MFTRTYNTFTCYIIAVLHVRALVMKTTLMAHLSLAPYKESVKSVQIQMLYHAVMRVGRSFRSYASAITHFTVQKKVGDSEGEKVKRDRCTEGPLV